MNTKYIVGIVVVLALIAGGVLFATQNTAEAPANDSDVPSASGEQNMNGSESTGTSVFNDENATATSAALVSYTDDGFAPTTVTIKKGESVTFMNETGPRMWVGSNIHPTHTLYPETTESDCLGSAFDMCEGVGAGENWTFTFNQVGEWKYHNHLRANHIGTVIVTEE